MYRESEEDRQVVAALTRRVGDIVDLANVAEAIISTLRDMDAEIGRAHV